MFYVPEGAENKDLGNKKPHSAMETIHCYKNKFLDGFSNKKKSGC